MALKVSEIVNHIHLHPEAVQHNHVTLKNGFPAELQDINVPYIGVPFDDKHPFTSLQHLSVDIKMPDGQTFRAGYSAPNPGNLLAGSSGPKYYLNEVVEGVGRSLDTPFIFETIQTKRILRAVIEEASVEYGVTATSTDPA